LKQLDLMEGVSPRTGNGQKFENHAGNGKDDLRRIASLSSEENDALEDMIALHRNLHKDKAAGFCPHCGRPIQKTDQFCRAAAKK